MEPEFESRYHSLLGAYIAKTTEIEGHVDSLISQYFQVNQIGAFQDWVLQRLEISMKIQVLDRIIEQINQKAETRILVKGLATMIERRNDLAHGRYMQVSYLRGGDGREDTNTLARTHRKSMPLDPNAYKNLGLDDLEKELNDLQPNVVVPLMALYMAVINLWPHSIMTDGKTIQVPGNWAEVTAKKQP